MVIGNVLYYSIAAELVNLGLDFMSVSDIVSCLAPESWDSRFLLQSFASLLLLLRKGFQVLEGHVSGQNINTVKVDEALFATLELFSGDLTNNRHGNGL